MTDSLTSPKPSSRTTLKDLFAFLLFPRQGVERLAASGKPAWLMPMLVLTALTLLQVTVSGYMRAHAAAQGQSALPAAAQWWTPEMQAKYMLGFQSSQEKAFVYILPAVGALTGLWLSWIILSGLFHLTSTLFGGRGSMGSAQNVVAWAGLPFALRDLLRVIFMVITRHAIVSTGLSGFVTGTTSGALFLAQMLAAVDLFFIWRALLLILGFRVVDNLPARKAVAGVLIVLLLALLVQAGLGTLIANLTGKMMISSPLL